MEVPQAHRRSLNPQAVGMAGAVPGRNHKLRHKRELREVRAEPQELKPNHRQEVTAELEVTEAEPVPNHNLKH